LPSAALLATLAVAVFAIPAAADSGHVAPASGAVRVFLDCPDCATANLDYLRDQVRFVDYVRDRAEADVQLLITSQDVGGGGAEITLTFVGRARFTGMDDTLRVVTKPADTDETTRAQIAQTFRLGLMRYVARTPLAPDVQIEYSPDEQRLGGPPASDPWHGWVFSTQASGFVTGQSSSRSGALNLAQSIERVLATWKIGVSASGSYREDRYTLSDQSRLLSIARNGEARGRIVVGLGGHWSSIVLGRVYSSSFDNIDVLTGAGPGLEFNVFPYAQSTRRELRIDYTAQAIRVRYKSPTIDDRLEEQLVREGVELVLNSTEPWGTSELSLEAQHYMPGFDRNHLRAEGSLSLRLAEGLSLDLGLSGERIRDQISLPRESATDEEILLQRRLLASEYAYEFSIGMRYTFGSIYNNVVNPRFGTRF
jgi:hypothetical protein